MYNLRINYAVAEVIQYLYDKASSNLKCLIHEDDESAAPRYYNSFKCRYLALPMSCAWLLRLHLMQGYPNRMVGETVLRTTFMSMAVCNSLDAAFIHAVNSLTYNAIHLSLVPVIQVGTYSCAILMTCMVECRCVCVCVFTSHNVNVSVCVCAGAHHPTPDTV